MKTLLALLLATASLFAATRPVIVSWVVGSPTGITGYNVYRAPSGSTTYALLTTTPLPATTTQYTDATAVIGSAYSYGVAAVAAPCSAAPLPTDVCGGAGSMITSPVINIPQLPGAFTTTIVIQVP